MNRRFVHIFRNEAKVFYESFTQFSKDLFTNSSANGYIHSAEFGRYRERAVERFLRLLTPQRLAFSDGFIITPRDQVSTQCDIIIYKKNDTPLINDNNATFFPVESVAGVVEVKSTLKKSELKDSLNKLARVKKLRDDIYNDKNNVLEISRRNNTHLPPQNNIWSQLDSIFTVLVCDKLDFDLDKFSPIELYDPSTPRYCWHNIILSLNDGVFLYSSERDHCWPVLPFQKSMLLSGFVYYPKEDMELSHIEFFGHFYNLGISMNSVFYPELSNYFNEILDLESTKNLIVPLWTKTD